MTDRLTLPSNSRWAALLASLQPQQFIPSAIAGIVVGIVGTIRAISYAALLFAGPLSESITVAVGITVFSTAAANVLSAATSALPGMIATPLASLTALIAALAAAIVADLNARGAAADTLLPTVLAAIALSSLLTGIFLLVLGRLQLGAKIRLIPYPVVCGFMAGTGWLLVEGAVKVTTEESLAWQTLPVLFRPETLALWGSALALGIVLTVVTRRYTHYAVMPGTLLGSIAGFYLIVALLQVPLPEVRAAGWLLGPFPAGDLWQPLQVSDLGGVHWDAIARQWSLLLSTMLVGLLSLLLSNSGIELALGKDIALNTELESIGWANIVSGFGSGMPVNQALPSTLLASKIGANNRWPGLFSAALCVAVLGFGSSFLEYFPRPILGALLFYLGIALLQERVYRSWFKLSRPDYGIAIATLLAIVTIGFLPGTIAGFVLAALLFMFNYSRLDVAQQVLTGAETASNVRRSPAATRWLQDEGDCLHILCLQDYIFFGTADYLLRRLRDRLDAPARPAVRFVVVDFSGVDGIDASGVLSFVKMMRLARQRQFELVFTHLDLEIQAQLERGGGLDPESDLCHLFPDLDRGLAWCEERLLDEANLTEAIPAITEHLSKVFDSRDRVAACLPYLQLQKVLAGERLFAGNAKGLYFIETGQVSVVLEMPNGSSKRLETQGPGSVLGEMRFYDKPPLSTSAIADCPCRLYFLDRAEFERMKNQDPALANALQEYIIGLLCDGLRRREQQLQVLA